MSGTVRKTKKIYYSMGEVSEMFDVNPSLIRFWEQKFTILKPDKNKKGNRLFTQQDVDNLKLIYHLVKENGMTLAGAQKRLKENREGIERNLEIIERLQGVKALLLEVRQELKSADSDDLEIVVENDMQSVADPAPTPPAASTPERSVPLAAEPLAESPESGTITEPAETVPAWPREQPLFPEYVTPAGEAPADPAGEPEPEAPEPLASPAPQAEKTEKRMQIIEQTLF